MTLLKTAAGKTFEDAATETPGADTQTSTAVETPASADTQTSTAVSEAKTSAVTVAKKVDLRAMDQYKDAMKVEYNTLNQIIATNGNFVDRETKTVLGDTVVFTLLSFQDSFVVSPNDDNAPDDVVRYSDDGVVCSDGTDVQEHLAFLKGNGFPKASLKQRAVVVAAVESAAKSDKFNGQLVQFDLSPSSRTMWKRYTANVAYALSVGTLKPEQVNRVKAETTIQQNGTNTFTQVMFSSAK